MIGKSWMAGRIWEITKLGGKREGGGDGTLQNPVWIGLVLHEEVTEVSHLSWSCQSFFLKTACV